MPSATHRPCQPLAQLLLIAGLLTAELPAMAEVQLPKVFSDNMMLQRDQPVRVWGWADAAEEVSASLSGATATTKADAQGQWSLSLPAVAQGDNLELIQLGFLLN